MGTPLNTPAFPVHKHTFQGTAVTETMADKPYKLLHANDAGDVTLTFEDATTKVVSLGIGEDINIPSAVSVSSTMLVKVS